MKVQYVTDDQLQMITEQVSASQYEGNVKINTAAAGFRLRVKDSRGPGARRAASGRRTVSACWHAHRDVMEEIFRQHPNAKITTALATYNGSTDFYEKYPGTAFVNVGSVMAPCYMPALCECGGRTLPPRPQRQARSYEEFYARREATRSPSPDAQRWSPAEADEELLAWDEFVAKVKDKTSRIVNR